VKVKAAYKCEDRNNWPSGDINGGMGAEECTSWSTIMLNDEMEEVATYLQISAGFED